MNKKAISILLCFGMCITMLAGCNQKDSSKETEEQSSKDEKVIKVGCEATTPGWIQTDKKGELSGYDYDVWTEIGERTGYKIEYKIMEWDGMGCGLCLMMEDWIP